MVDPEPLNEYRVSRFVTDGSEVRVEDGELTPTEQAMRDHILADIAARDAHAARMRELGHDDIADGFYQPGGWPPR